MIIYLFDHQMFHPTPLRGIELEWNAARPRAGRVRMVAGSREPLENIIRRVREASEGEGSIWALKISAHGNSGSFNLGNHTVTVDEAHYFEGLSGYFSPDGPGIELHSCGTGSSSILARNVPGTDFFGRTPGTFPVSIHERGMRFVIALSRAANTRVTAAIGLQEPDAHWQFEGETFTFP